MKRDTIILIEHDNLSVDPTKAPEFTNFLSFGDYKKKKYNKLAQILIFNSKCIWFLKKYSYTTVFQRNIKMHYTLSYLKTAFTSLPKNHDGIDTVIQHWKQ